MESNGLSLYHFDGDANGKIGCVADCTDTWPPLLLPAGAEPTGAGVSDLGTIDRPEGTRQVTHQGEPLYRFNGDIKAGDTNGDGVGGAWHIATLEQMAVSVPPTTAYSPPQTSYSPPETTYSGTTAPPETTSPPSTQQTTTSSPPLTYSSSTTKPCPYPPCY